MCDIGAYEAPSSPAVPTATRTPTATPVPDPCSPRPNVRVSAVPDNGQLRVTLTAGQGGIRQVRLGQAQNALIDIAGQSGLTGGQTIDLDNQPGEITFFVRRAGSAAFHVPLTVVDQCGDWPTFVGGGPGAF
jgi:hypothetical protein